MAKKAKKTKKKNDEPAAAKNSGKAASKSDKVKEFLKGKTFSGCSQALDQFETESGLTMTYPQFNSIWNIMLKKNEFTVVEAVKQLQQNGSAANIIPEDQQEEITLYFPDQIEGMFDESILIPFKSKTILDNIITSYGGILPATVGIVPGEPAVGKTSVLLGFLCDVKRVNPKVEILLVLTEMNIIHMYKYMRRIKLAGVKIHILFLGEYDYPHDVLERELAKGYDIVLIDSFQDCVDKVKDGAAMGGQAAERWLLKLMDKTRLKGNAKGKYTSFLCTQHMTKGGNYTGSSRVKHMTDSMMNLSFDGEERFIEFNKNRDGSVRKRLYFELTDTGATYDVKRFQKDEEIKVAVSKEKGAREAEGEKFDALVDDMSKESHASLIENNKHQTVEA